LLGGSKPGQQQQGPWQLESYNGNLFCLLIRAAGMVINTDPNERALSTVPITD